MPKHILNFEHPTFRGDPFIHATYRHQKSDEIVQKNIMDFEHPT